MTSSWRWASALVVLVVATAGNAAFLHFTAMSRLEVVMTVASLVLGCFGIGFAAACLVTQRQLERRAATAAPQPQSDEDEWRKLLDKRRVFR
jgi:hypothetical protein